ncbi:hypothetical protein GQ44DRAFT_770613 [Phaeosphaeriaceae sp. PMI808]|nr:hypothetical protein GQ44DRAFT_770613 [Phaeosphaeriaceae sp. PMI808]
MKLVRFLMKCQNETVTVELKNGKTSSTQCLWRFRKLNCQRHYYFCLPLMNVALRAVKYTPKSRDTVALDTMTVRGSTVRYIILPDSLPLDTLLIDDAPKPKNKARKEAERGGGSGGGRGGPGRGGGRGGGGRGGGRGRGGGGGRGRGRGF